MLQAMRRSMKVVLWVTIIFFVLLIFLVWGADLQLGAGPQPGMVGEVNGEPVPAATYQQLLDLNRRNFQASGRDLLPGDELVLEEQTWNSLVNEILLRQEAKRRGLVARDSEVRAILLNDPPPVITQDPNFRNEQGQFDLATYRALIRDPQTPETFLLQLEAYVRDYLPTQKLQDIVVSGAKVTDEELRRAYLLQSERATATLVEVDAFAAPFNANLPDEDLQKYYEENREDWRRPRRVDVVYVMVPRRATREDSLAIQADLAEYARDAREAETAARSGQVATSVSDFATLAMSFSDGPTAENGGLSAEYLGPEAMSPTLQAVVTSLQPGQVSDPFQDGLFYQIVQLVDVKEEGGRPTYRIRDLTVRIAPSDSTLEAEMARLEDLRRSAASRGLRAAAEERGLSVREAKDVLPTGIAPGLSAVPDVGPWAHANPKGTVSRVFSGTTGWYVLEVGDEKPEGVPPFEEVRDQVRNELVRERRLEAVRPTADRIAERVGAGMTLEAAASAENLLATKAENFTRLSGLPGLGQEPDVTAAAFVLPLGKVSDPMKTQRSWVLLRVDDRPQVDWAAFDRAKEGLRRSRTSVKESELLTALVMDLRKKAKIVDYRS
jgi:parvulin-like peptidyl-prolyl isomerase